MSLVRVERPH
uniref:Uncharacterized protein n=1 Tax=Lepeophtheirus salmonis TaxID=72036 RepID=A0A0K2UY08_LEPSM